MVMRYFYNSETQRVERYTEKCPICGESGCDCNATIVDALNKLISQLGKDFGVSNAVIREYIKDLYTR